MSVNNFLPHVLVIPEDAANREIANGFVLDNRVQETRIQIMLESGGWSKVLDTFIDQQIKLMRKFTDRRIVLLIDFDDQIAVRQTRFCDAIPADLADRVFVIGVGSNPENLRAACNKKFEPIGETLSKECAENTQELWAHQLLRHNAAELARLNKDVKPFLFKKIKLP